MITPGEKAAAFDAHNAAYKAASADGSTTLMQNQDKWNGIHLITLALHGHRAARRSSGDEFSAPFPNVKLWIDAHTPVICTVMPTHLHFADELDLWSGQPLPVP